MCAYSQNSMSGGGNMLISYDCISGRFTYLSDMGRLWSAHDPRALWEILREDGRASAATVQTIRSAICEMAESSVPCARSEEYSIRTSERGWRWYRADYVCAEPGQRISIVLTDISDEIEENSRLVQMISNDALTGLLSHGTFCQVAEEMLLRDPQGVKEGKYAVICFDLMRFKAINDLFGMERGDRLLVYIADQLRASLGERDAACRITADHFAVFMEDVDGAAEKMLGDLLEAVARYDLPFETMLNAGIYKTGGEEIGIDAMIGRATLAQSSIKGSYTIKYRYYAESLRHEMLGEHEIVGTIASALAGGQFIVHYQPQYNHSTGLIVGAEALVRWNHPERGMLHPGKFVPVFEKNGFITTLDFHVFEQVCALLARCCKQDLPVVPIAVNFSRNDIFYPDFVAHLEEIRHRYGIAADLLRVELTESVFIDSCRQVNEVISALHACGYQVEMDDFGSGYSSLNLFKDTDVDGLKLDMEFISGEDRNGKGGIILSSVVRMARWLNIPVIAEGVETVRQADFLRSIGCDCVQGYLYARPMDEEDFLKAVGRGCVRGAAPQMQLVDTLNAADFWNPESMETLIFSHYAGAAAIFVYEAGRLEMLRVNPKYLQELSMNISEREAIESDTLYALDEENRSIYRAALQRAIETGEAQECETWRTITSKCCGSELLCIRSNLRVIGRSGAATLFYVMIRNVTQERRMQEEMISSERRFRAASEQVNIYYWEYTIATREMRPCFRCMRDLGLPPLLTNYPDSAIELGVFPPEVADMYRDWHDKVAQGVPELEAIIPLTMNRVPFRVRYTTEYDAQGRPVKAYGSAALVKEIDAVQGEAQQSEENRRMLQLISRHSDRVVIHYDLATRAIRFRDESEDMYNLNKRTIASLFDEGRIQPESIGTARRILADIDRGVPYGRDRILFMHRKDHYCWLDFKYTTLFDSEKKPVAAFLSYQDITDQVEAQQRSEIDGMTGIYNRVTAEAEIRKRLRDTSRTGMMLMMDLDGLKEINDTYGHHIGDEAIVSVASVIRAHFRRSDIVGRFGGDEFIVFLPGAAHSHHAIKESLNLLAQELERVRIHDAQQLRIGCSIGCAPQKEQGDTFESIYRRADEALYRAKRSGKNRCVFFSEEAESAETPAAHK